jgi:hypothetical protein
MTLREWIYSRTLSARLLVPVAVGLFCSLWGIPHGPRQWGIDFLFSTIAFALVKEVLDWPHERTADATANKKGH